MIVAARGWRRLVLIALAACGGAGHARPRAPIVADPIRVVEVTAQPALVTTVRAAPAELGAQLGAAILGLVARATAQDLAIAGPPFARYLAREPVFVVEAGLPLVKPMPGGATLPAGPAATLVFVGRHEELGRAHAALDAWLAEHHRTAAGPRWEVFLTSPLTTPDPAAQRTQVFAPLAP